MPLFQKSSVYIKTGKEIYPKKISIVRFDFSKSGNSFFALLVVFLSVKKLLELIYTPKSTRLKTGL